MPTENQETQTQETQAQETDKPEGTEDPGANEGKKSEQSTVEPGKEGANESVDPSLVLTPEQLEEYKKLQSEAEQARRNALDKESQLTEDLQAAQAQIKELTRANLITSSGVPDSLVPLIPADLEKAKEFLGSDKFQSLKTALDNVESVTAKSGAQDSPQNKSNRKQGDPVTEVGSLLVSSMGF